MKVIDVLDRGFVRLVEHVGGDLSVVRAARVCYDSASKGEDADRKLIRYLLVNKHGTPFEHNSLTFHVKVPIFVARQWHRHRIGVSYNEISGRYAEVKDEFYVPQVWRKQDTTNKQGSVAADFPHATFAAIVEANNIDAMMRYRLLLSQGVAKEMARIVLPQNVFTEFYFTCNARSLMAFLTLRSDKHAQFEMRQYSNALWKLWSPLMPWTAEAFLSTLDLQRYLAEGGGTAGPNEGDIKELSHAA